MYCNYFDGQTVSGRPPPAVSMAVGQFFNPDAGRVKISPWSMLLPKYYNDVNTS